MSKFTVLERRRERESNLRFMRMVGVSVLAHLLVLSTAALAHRPPRSPLREKAVMVNLYAPPKPVRKAASKPTAALPAPKKAVQKSAPSAVAEKAKTEEKTAKKVVSTSKEKSPPPEEKETQTVVTDSDRKLMEEALGSISRSLKSEEQARQQQEWNQAFQDISSSLQARAYREHQVRESYLKAWVYPLSMRSGPDRGCRVIIYVDQDGTVKAYKMVQSSGSEAFDQSVLRVIQKVRSLPPVPWPVTQLPLALPLEFRPENQEGA